MGTILPIVYGILDLIRQRNNYSTVRRLLCLFCGIGVAQWKIIHHSQDRVDASERSPYWEVKTGETRSQIRQKCCLSF